MWQIRLHFGLLIENIRGVGERLTIPFSGDVVPVVVDAEDLSLALVGETGFPVARKVSHETYPVFMLQTNIVPFRMLLLRARQKDVSVLKAGTMIYLVSCRRRQGCAVGISFSALHP